MDKTGPTKNILVKLFEATNEKEGFKPDCLIYNRDVHKKADMLAAAILFLLQMASPLIPNQTVLEGITDTAMEAIRSRTFLSETDHQLRARICATCDGISTIENPCKLLGITAMIILLKKSQAEKSNTWDGYPAILVDQYTAKDLRLQDYILSPSTTIIKTHGREDSVAICRNCHKEFRSNKPRCRIKHFRSPVKAIWNGLLIGNPPECMACLRPVEIALISPNRVITHAITLQANHHDGIYGWHSMFENRVDLNLGHVNYLVNSGLSGEIVVALCGPFTSTQKAMAKEKVGVRADKVIAAFEWLKINNPYFKDLEIPDPSQIPLQYHMHRVQTHTIFRVQLNISTM